MTIPCNRAALALALTIAAASLAAPAGAAVVLRDDFSDRASGWPNAAATRSSDLGFAVYTERMYLDIGSAA